MIESMRQSVPYLGALLLLIVVLDWMRRPYGVVPLLLYVRRLEGGN